MKKEDRKALHVARCTLNVSPGSCQVVEAEGKEVAVFNVQGRFYAIANRCPHRKGPLSRGHIEFPSLLKHPSPQLSCLDSLHPDLLSQNHPHPNPLPGGEGGLEGAGAPAVRCPLHGWLFDLESGRCLNQEDTSTSTYTVVRKGAGFHLEPYKSGRG